MKKKILLVEDNVSNQELFIEILKTSNKYELVVVDNGLKALELLETFKPDLILMDIHMPNLDGLAVTRTIKSISSLAHIPIVALSALAMKRDIQAAMDAGCIGYITKPIRIKHFLEQLDKYMGEGHK
jgi:two-component system cell cycle response regulator DivK